MPESKNYANPSQVPAAPDGPKPFAVGDPPMLDIKDPQPLNDGVSWQIVSQAPGQTTLQQNQSGSVFQITVSGSAARVDRYIKTAKISVAAKPQEGITGPRNLRREIEMALLELRPGIEFLPGRSYIDIAKNAEVAIPDVVRTAAAILYRDLAAGLRNGLVSVKQVQAARFEARLLSTMRQVAREAAAPVLPDDPNQLVIQLDLIKTDRPPGLWFVGIRVDPPLEHVLNGVEKDTYIGTFSDGVSVDLSVSQGQVQAALSRSGVQVTRNQVLGNAVGRQQISVGHREGVELRIDNDTTATSKYSFSGESWKQVN
jgi:hypothetical protein